MPYIDQIIADALAGSPETHVAMLAREVVRLREAAAVVVPDDDRPSREFLENYVEGFDPGERSAALFGWREGRRHLREHSRAIPADRVPGDGMVAVDREEFDGATRWTFEGIDIHKVEHKKGFWFAVRCGNSCMSRAGKWDLEPLPSSRTPEFFAEFRFDTFRDALIALRANQGGVAT